MRGTNAYWFKQRSRLTAMVDTVGLPTVFFTHSAADMQWPELARLICPHNPTDKNCRKQALIENPAIADWFFCQRIQLFLKYFYKEILHAKDYWLRFEWQHRGSPHVQGLAWLQGAPDIEGTFSSGTIDDQTKSTIIKYIDSIVCTTNPSILPDGSNASDAPPPQTNPHVTNLLHM